MSVIVDTVFLFFGISYIFGKFITESIISTFGFLFELSGSLGTAGKEVVLWIIEFEKDVAKALVTLGYGIGQIGDCFGVTFNDLCECVQAGAVAIGTFLATIATNLTNLVLLTLTTVPYQVLTVFALCGDNFLSLCEKLCALGTWILVDIPLKGFIGIYQFWNLVLKIPAQFIDLVLAVQIDIRTILGILLLFCTYFAYCKFNTIVFLNGLGRVGRVSGNGLKYLIAVLMALTLVPLLRIKFLGPIVGGIGATDGFDKNDTTNFDPERRGICVVCQDDEVCFMAIPCSHVALCRDCCHQLAKSDNRCAVCRNVVRKYSRVYLP